MMTSEMVAKLRHSLIKHEGFEKFPYIDTAGKITIGIGYNLSDRGISEDWINSRYLEDTNYFYNQLLNLPWFENLNSDRQIILIDMCFMGWKKFLEFTKMLEALAKYDFKTASQEMLNSEWADQVKSRALFLSHGMLTGIYNV